MKAEELRIGNLVKEIATGECTVNIYLLSFVQQANTNNHQTDRYTPIPLTEKWLLKFGFKKQKEDNGNYTIANEDSVLLLNYNKRVNEIHSVGIIHPMIDDTLTNFAWHIKYVHRLQNLYYALTGNELTIKS